jgi:superoxide reductase
MAERLQVYKCKACGNIVEVLNGGAGTLTCCGASMELLEEKTADAATEKHVPVIEKIDGGYKIKVGSVPHPMTEEHLIEWIELLADGKAYRQFLQAGAEPEAIFLVEGNTVSAREYCNIHGLWKG